MREIKNLYQNILGKTKMSYKDREKEIDNKMSKIINISNSHQKTLPCPFCGKNDELYLSIQGHFSHINCEKCNIAMSISKEAILNEKEKSTYKDAYDWMYGIDEEVKVLDALTSNWNKRN